LDRVILSDSVRSHPLRGSRCVSLCSRGRWKAQEMAASDTRRGIGSDLCECRPLKTLGLCGRIDRDADRGKKAVGHRLEEETAGIRVFVSSRQSKGICGPEA